MWGHSQLSMIERLRNSSLREDLFTKQYLKKKRMLQATLRNEDILGRYLTNHPLKVQKNRLENSS